MRRATRVLVPVLALTLAWGAAGEDPPARPKAPELDGGVGWLNVKSPLRLAELRGKVVLLDFWTYCCINCIHVVPQLKQLEKKHGHALVVIGVHSAKFKDEGETARIRQAVMRYGLEHPVVNDREFAIWRRYQVRAWPTVVLVDPEGFVAARRSGEGVFEFFDPLITELVRHYREKKLLDERPLAMALEQDPPGSPDEKLRLKFPGKVLAAGGRIFISDSNHHRILVADPTGKVLETIGSGKEGAEDGEFAAARFKKPQGMALAGDRLYVADTENHLVRVADLARRRVDTVAGTGEQARRANEAGPARTTALASPWDLAVAGRKLYIAMAGPHQLWVLDLEAGRVAPHAGSGREAIRDGPLPEAALAQPSGLALADGVLYFADSESSAVRAADTDPAGRVRTVVGPAERTLFDFGDQDGVGDEARLQHPLGVALAGGLVYVADTYNDKIKVVDPKTRRCTTLLGGRGVLHEPGGLSVADGKLYIADTNAHRVMVWDLAGKKLERLVLK